jgi:hypothetical protein
VVKLIAAVRGWFAVGLKMKHARLREEKVEQNFADSTNITDDDRY